MCINNAQKPTKKYKEAYKVVARVDDYYVPMYFRKRLSLFKKDIKYYLNKTCRIFFNKYSKNKIWTKIDRSGFHLFIDLEDAKIYANGYNAIILKCKIDRVKWEGITRSVNNKTSKIDTIIVKKFKPIEEI